MDRIDGKVSALLTFDGIGIAVLTVVFTTFNVFAKELYFESFFTALSGLFMVLSGYMCLTMIYLYGYHSSDGISAKEYEKKIIAGVVLRTKRYNLALKFNHISSVCFLLFIFTVFLRFLSGFYFSV